MTTDFLISMKRPDAFGGEVGQCERHGNASGRDDEAEHARTRSPTYVELSGDEHGGAWRRVTERQAWTYSTRVVCWLTP